MYLALKVFIYFYGCIYALGFIWILACYLHDYVYQHRYNKAQTKPQFNGQELAEIAWNLESLEKKQAKNFWDIQYFHEQSAYFSSLALNLAWRIVSCIGPEITELGRGYRIVRKPGMTPFLQLDQWDSSGEVLLRACAGYTEELRPTWRESMHLFRDLNTGFLEELKPHITLEAHLDYLAFEGEIQAHEAEHHMGKFD